MTAKLDDVKTTDPIVCAVHQNVLAYKAKLSDRPFYVACSGGRDSLVLAYVCVLLHKAKMLPKPALIHVNHNMQKTSGAWAKGVQDFANRYGLACHIVSVKLADTSEQGARQARRLAFFETMANDGVIALAHHSDDQAETVLMRMINGTGIKGLGGMHVWQTHKQNTKTIHLFRPLLSVSRDDISRTAHAHALPYVDDPTNETGDNVRAIFRRQLMPILRQINPKATDNIVRTATLAKHSYTLVNQHIKDTLAYCLIKDCGWQCTLQGIVCPNWQSCLDVGLFLALDDETQMAVLHAFIQGDEINSACYAFVCLVKDLCHKTATDHQTVLFWQGQSAWVFVRYDKILYRYHHAVWQALQQKMTAWTDDGGITLGNEQKTVCFRRRFLMGDDITLKTLSKTDKITINIGKERVNDKTLSGKKLYQTLRIPVWYRKHLFLLHADKDSYLFGLSGIWAVKSATLTDKV